jgi:hypothetical protein
MAEPSRGPPGLRASARLAEVDECPRARGEAVGLGQVDEVAAVWPLLELGGGHELAEVVAFAQ